MRWKWVIGESDPTARQAGHGRAAAAGEARQVMGERGGTTAVFLRIVPANPLEHCPPLRPLERFIFVIPVDSSGAECRSGEIRHAPTPKPANQRGCASTPQATRRQDPRPGTRPNDCAFAVSRTPGAPGRRGRRAGCPRHRWSGHLARRPTQVPGEPYRARMAGVGGGQDARATGGPGILPGGQSKCQVSRIRHTCPAGRGCNGLRRALIRRSHALRPLRRGRFFQRRLPARRGRLSSDRY